MRKFVFLVTLLLALTIFGLKIYYPERTSPRKEILKKYNAENTTEAYMNLPYDEKVRLIGYLKEKWKADGIIIAKPASEYVNILDEVLAEDSKLINAPFGVLIKDIFIRLNDFKEEG